MSLRLRGGLVGLAITLFLVLGVTGCTPRPRGLATPYVDVPRTDITAVGGEAHGVCGARSETAAFPKLDGRDVGARHVHVGRRQPARSRRATSHAEHEEQRDRQPDEATSQP